jgi:hypothetical protein
MNSGSRARFKRSLRHLLSPKPLARLRVKNETGVQVAQLECARRFHREDFIVYTDVRHAPGFHSRKTPYRYARKTRIGSRGSGAKLVLLCTPMVPLSHPLLLARPGTGPGPPKSPESARLITACPHIASSAGAPVALATLEHKSLLETRIVVSWLARAPHRRAGRRPPNRRRVFSAPWTRKSTRRLASWGGVPGQRPVGFSHTVQKHVSRPLWRTMQALRQQWRPN